MCVSFLVCFFAFFCFGRTTILLPILYTVGIYILSSSGEIALFQCSRRSFFLLPFRSVNF